MKKIKPIVYAYEDEIVEFYKLNADEHGEKKIITGFAFEWQGENVFHLHTAERVAYGYPCLAVFVMLPKSIDISGIDTKVNQFLDEYFSPNYQESKRKIVVCVFQLKGKTLQKKGFLRDADGLHLCQFMYVPQKSELYSRSKGLLEVGVLENKTVSVVGLGSFGSNVAIELAKAGVGNFNLFDYDRIELGNISRHQCGISDLGRFKTRAVKDAILQKNPFAKVNCYEININEHVDFTRRVFANSDLIICLTDENQSRILINSLALETKKVALFGRAITRAEGGDVFRLRGNDTSAPCFACLIGNGLFDGEREEVSTIKQANRDMPAYASEAEKNVVVQVGLSCDIAPICNMIVKLALVELSKGLNSGISSLEEDLIADYYIWANRRDDKYKTLPPMEYFANKPSILRWYGVRVEKDKRCLICNNNYYHG